MSSTESVPCPHCTKPRKKVNEYLPPTCGRSACQEASYHLNKERNALKKRRYRAV